MNSPIGLLVLVFCCASVRSAATVGGGGLRPLRVTDRIVGGTAATVDQFPWIVSMQRFGAHRCGAAIVSPWRILTAAHCTDTIPAGQLSVRAGSSYSSDFGQLVQVDELHQHPDYNGKNFHNDLCVMWLNEAIDTRPSGVAVAPMPYQHQEVKTGAAAWVAGWGHEKEGAAVNSKVLRAVQVPIVDQKQCKQWYKNSITDGMVCAGYAAGGKDACQNDSGGPLTVDGLLVGIVSWGVGCAQKNQPGVYARVAYYRNWIEGWMREDEYGPGTTTTPKPRWVRRPGVW